MHEQVHESCTNHSKRKEAKVERTVDIFRRWMSWGRFEVLQSERPFRKTVSGRNWVWSSSYDEQCSALKQFRMIQGGWYMILLTSKCRSTIHKHACYGVVLFHFIRHIYPWICGLRTHDSSFFAVQKQATVNDSWEYNHTVSPNSLEAMISLCRMSMQTAEEKFNIGLLRASFKFEN